MRKVVIAVPGGHDKLTVREVPSAPMPEGGLGVRIAVEAIGVNYADCIVRMGLYSSAREYVGWPITPGFEVAGEVVEVGDAVDDVRPGDAVMALTRFDGYASELVVPRHQVFARPAGWTAAEAATFPAVHLTAHYALRLADAPPGSSVLVHSAAGGVGSALVTLARLRGLRVVGVVGASHKVEHVRALGAAAVIDKRRHRLWPAASAAAPTGYAAVFDANGVSTLRESYEHLAPTGRLVVYGFHSMMPRRGGRVRWTKLIADVLRTPRFDPLDLTDRNRSVMGFNLSYLFEREDLLEHAMTELLAAIEAGRLPPPAVHTYALCDVASAHRDLESGRTIGKLALVV